ncbi:MAG: carbon-nitrogen hydrolase family protein [Eubacteriales bacterium]
MKSFKIGVCQMSVGHSKEENLARAAALAGKAAASGALFVVLPEMFNCPYKESLFPFFSEVFPEGQTFQMLANTAQKENIYLIGGSVPERCGDVIYNTSFAFDPQGRLIARHRKMHLFDVDITGGVTFQESKTLARGKQITIAKTELCTFGLAICYDIRFPELSRLMVLEGAEIIVIPGAFNMKTGPAHWELLLRARAVDNQAYIVGAAPARDPGASYVSYGHSLVADPWGDVVAQADEKEEIIYAEIDPGLIAKVRRELPLILHRRTDLYKLTKLE